MRPILFLSSFLTFPALACAQAWLPVNHYYRHETEDYLLQNHRQVFTALHPIPLAALHDSLFQPATLLGIPGKKPYRWWILRKLRQEDLATVHADGLVLKVNGLADFSAAREKGDSRLLYRNTRGVLFEGTIQGTIGFSSALYENQARFPGYVRTYIQSHQVLPGQGIAKKYQTDGYDFSWAEGNLWVRPWKDLYFDAGFGKRFFGDGYRSLLLSDFSHLYPYAGYRWYGRKFFLAASTQSFIQHEPVIKWDKRRFPAKTAVFHFAGMQLGGLQLTLMEANMYANPDSSGNFRWQAELFNPLPVLNTLAGRGKSLWGINLSFSTASVQWYGQLLIDEYPADHPFDFHSVRNKTGFQAGIKWFRALWLPGLYMQAEYNQVRPYTYEAEALPLSFTHYNEPLAHPLGANFREGLVLASYRKNFLLLEMQASWAVQGMNDGSTDWGAYPLLRDGHLPEKVLVSGKSHMLQGVKSTVMNAFAGISWIVNPVNTLHLSLEYHYRSQATANIRHSTGYVMIALRTNRINHYYDF